VGLTALALLQGTVGCLCEGPSAESPRGGEGNGTQRSAGAYEHTGGHCGLW
jgi:hypothetical protein